MQAVRRHHVLPVRLDHPVPHHVPQAPLELFHVPQVRLVRQVAMPVLVLVERFVPVAVEAVLVVVTDPMAALSIRPV